MTLYHELSHALRMATGGLLGLASPGPGVCPASPEEHAAETDENDMRTQLGVPLRDATDHCAQSCSVPPPSCCIVASISTGSYSTELNTLRQIRDRFLRRSEIGYDFFEHLHYDYYAFSPEVCRAMAGDPQLVSDIAAYYVRPLTAFLTLAYARLVEGVSARALGKQFVTDIPLQLRETTPDAVERAIETITAAAAPELATPRLPTTPTYAVQSQYVRWALIDTITIYLEAIVQHKRGASPDRIGAAIACRLDRWASNLPITQVWAELSDYAFAEELAFLDSCLLPISRRSPAIRRPAAERAP